MFVHDHAGHAPSPRFPRAVRGTPLWLDGVIALLLFIGAATGGLSYWKRTVAGGQPFYYQNYFEPAVMIGCGKGFVVARPQVPAMVPFLWRQTDRFSCAAIAPDAPLGTEDMYQQGSWRYLMLAVGFTWRLFGVSWSALGPLFAALFGVTIASVYAVFRLGMTPLLAVAGALLLRFSDLHLKYFPVLRDYAKAPFALVLIFLLGLLVTRRTTWRGVLSTAAAYGAVAGIGYGFRTDFLAFLPPLFVTLVAFLHGGVFRNTRLKLAAGALCIVTFVVAAWPVLSTLDRSRAGCQWHVVLLGFARQFAQPLGVEPAPYDVNREYLDEFAYTNVTSYAARVRPDVGHIEYCEAGYGAATRAYLTAVVERFPADVVVRGYASVLRIVELPFAKRVDDDGQQTPSSEEAGPGRGLALVGAAIVVATAANIRAGLFIVFFLLYFAGLPAIQFDRRHFFYLEFLTWWAAGFLVQTAVSQVRYATQPDAWRTGGRSVARAALVLAGCVVVLAATLWTARLYQQATVRSLLVDYLAAPRTPIHWSPASAESQPVIRVSPRTDPETADFVAVDLDGSRCGERSTVAFRYADGARRAYSRVFEIQSERRLSGLTHIFMPVYDGFGRLELSDSVSGCVEGVYRVRELRRFPLLLEVVLRPGWRRAPLYQRLRAF